MKTSHSTYAIVMALFSAFAVGCAAPSEGPSEETAPTSAAVAESKSELQLQIDAFTNAVFTHDVTALSGIVSGEIHARGTQRGMTIETFLDRQKKAIVSTFELKEGEIPQFEVAEAIPDGDGTRVTLRFRGEDLKKPFYFVREDGALKLNIAPPGFSRLQPQGALFGRSNYQVHNVNIRGNANTFISCDGATLSSAPQSTKSMSCVDHCGWWSGTAFQVGERVKYCDWNSWGDDVIINLLDSGGFHCNDGC